METNVKLYVRTRQPAHDCHEQIKIKNKVIQVARNGHVLELQTDGISDDGNQNDFFTLISPSTIIKHFLDGCNSIVMCYGAFQSGKTFTLTGSSKIYANRGLIPRFITEIFEQIQTQNELETSVITIRISSMQIHGDSVMDLLRPEGITETTFDDVLRHEVTDAEDAMCLFVLADKQQRHFLRKRKSDGFPHTWAHFFFQIEVQIKALVLLNKYEQTSTLKFVNIAGCVGPLHDPISKDELIARQMMTLWENDMYNKKYIQKTYKPNCHRCKLSYLLHGSETSYFTVILTIWCARDMLSETLGTIKFGRRILGLPRKTVKPNIKDINADMLSKLQQEVTQLKTELYAYQLTYKNKRPVNHLQPRDNELKMLYSNVAVYMENESNYIDVVSRGEVNAAFAMMRNMYTSEKNKCLLHKKSAETSRSSERTVLTPDNFDPSFEVKSGQSVSTVKFGGILDAQNGFAVGTARKELEYPREYHESLPLEQKMKENVRAGSRMAVSAFGLVRGKIVTPLHFATSRQEAFAYFKRELAPDLVHTLRDFKTLAHTKKERFNALVTELRDTVSFKPTIIDDPYDQDEILELNYNKRRALLNQAKNLETVITNLYKVMHETRLRIMSEFENWYELKIKALAFQESFGDPDPLKHSHVALARQDHRQSAKKINRLAPSQAIFETAQHRVSQWISHMKRRRTEAKNTKPTFDFLQKVTIS